MSLSISFESLSIEDEELETLDAEQHLDPSIKNPLTQEEYLDCVSVIETWKGVNDRGYITRNDVLRLHDMKDKFPQLGTFFARHPLGSFTTEPSRVNYEESNEGFLSTIATTLINAIKAAIKWIVDKTTALWNWFTKTAVRSGKVEGLAPNLLALQGYLQEVVPLLESGSQSVKFKPYFKRTLDTQLHNVNKNWSALSDAINKNEGRYSNDVAELCLVLSTQVPSFVNGVQTLLNALSGAETEDQVKAAVSTNSDQRMHARINVVVSLAMEFGYNPNVRRGAGVTDWQSKCQVILGHYRSLSNDKRVSIPEASFRALLLNARISGWAKSMEETERELGSSIPDMIKKLNNFDASKMNPSLDAAYQKHLVDYIPELVSTLQGFSHLQEAISLLASVRDASTYNLAKAALVLVKDADRFVTENFDSLTLSEQVVRKKHKSAVSASFS